MGRRDAPPAECPPPPDDGTHDADTMDFFRGRWRMRSVLTLSLPALVVLLTACSDSAELASAPDSIRPASAMEQNQRTALDTVVTNRCTGERVHLVGATHVVYSLTSDAAGGLHLAFTSTTHLSGEGLTSGATYHSMSTGHFSQRIAAVPWQQTSVGSTRLLRRGAGDDIRVFYLQHITVDANGVMRVYDDDFRSSCR
jgi:hypothetical protein